MDDRLTLAMYWEMTDRSIDEHREARATVLAEAHGVSRVSYWRSIGDAIHEAVPQRRHLALHEVSGSFTPPEPLKGDRTFHFVQTRPSQGILGSASAKSLWTVMVHPNGDSSTYRDWADFVHLPPIIEARLPGFRQVTPYRNARTDDGDVPEWMNFWDLDTDDPAAAIAELGPAMVARLGQDTPEFQSWLNAPGGYTVMSRGMWIRV